MLLLDSLGVVKVISPFHLNVHLIHLSLLRGQTLHNISHDIRTPLTVTSDYVQILKKEQSVQPQLLKIEIALKTISKDFDE